jgi:hypothetical protein
VLILAWFKVLGVSLDTLMAKEDEEEEEEGEGEDDIETITAVQSITTTASLGT